MRVALSCRFAVITPVISNLFGGTVRVVRGVRFPVKTGMTASSSPAAGRRGSADAAFSGNAVITSVSPSTISGVAPFVVEFRDTSGGNPTAWTGTFRRRDDSTAQDPLNHTFTTAGTYTVTMHGEQRARLELATMT